MFKRRMATAMLAAAAGFASLVGGTSAFPGDRFGTEARAADNSASPLKGQVSKTASQAKQNALLRSAAGSSTGWFYPGRGWSVAQDRRRARKRRNVSRNRRAHRA